MILEGSLDTFDKTSFEYYIRRKFSNAEDIILSYLSASVLVNITLVYDDDKIANSVSSEIQKLDPSSVKNEWFNNTFVVSSLSSELIENEIMENDSGSNNHSLIWQISLVVVAFLVVCLCLRFWDKKKKRALISDTTVNTNNKIRTSPRKKSTSSKKIKTENVRFTIQTSPPKRSQKKNRNSQIQK